MSSEYKLSTYTPKGWIIKRAYDAYDAVIERAKTKESTSLAMAVNPHALETAIYAALDAAVEIGFLKHPSDEASK